MIRWPQLDDIIGRSCRDIRRARDEARELADAAIDAAWRCPRHCRNKLLRDAGDALDFAIRCARALELKKRTVTK